MLLIAGYVLLLVAAYEAGNKVFTYKLFNVFIDKFC
jgi:hypothetical protein